MTSSAQVTQVAWPSRISWWHPPDVLEVTGPGTAITGRPSSRACRAVFSAPLRSPASTTTVPRGQGGDEAIAGQEPAPLRELAGRGIH